MRVDDGAVDFPEPRIIRAPSFRWQNEALAAATHKPHLQRLLGLARRPPSDHVNGPDEMKALAGHDLGRSDWLQITQSGTGNGADVVLGLTVEIDGQPKPTSRWRLPVPAPAM